MVYNKAVFIDQSAFLAYLGHSKYSEFHEIINNWFTSYLKGDLASKYDILITSDYVVLSVLETLFERNQKDVMIQFIKNLIRSSSIKILNVNQDGFIHAWRNLETYYSIFKFNFSFIDIATLFLLKSSKIKAILTCNPSFHRLEYLIRLDFNPDKNESDNTLFYDAIPDTIFSSVKESPFEIYNRKVRPEDAIALFEIEVTQWTIKSIEVDQDFYVTKIKLDYEFDTRIEERKGESRSIPDSILKLERLISLDLSNIKISEKDKAIFDIIPQLAHLTYLDLRNNNLKVMPINLEQKLEGKCQVAI